jgi:FkbM family methyltransferase
MHIHALLKDRARQGGETFILQIGAMDGQTDDPVHESLMCNDWPALLVEPVAEYFEQLRAVYRDRPLVRFANLAVAEHSGETEFHRITPEAIAAGQVPEWGHGASSLYRDRNALDWEHIRPHIITETVPCLTLPDLLKSFAIERIDVLQIDAEGHDFAILRQLDFKRYRPAIINLEIVNLPEDEQEMCRALLSANGYVWEKTGYDLVAVYQG